MKSTVIRIRILLLLFIFIVLAVFHLQAQDLYAGKRQSWLDKAAALKPVLTETVKHPTGIVKLEKDAGAFQGWKAVSAGGMEQLYDKPLKKKTAVL